MGVFDFVANYAKQIIFLVVILVVAFVIFNVFTYSSNTALCSLSSKIRDEWMKICLVEVGEIRHFCIGDYLQFPLMGCAPGKVKVGSKQELLEQISKKTLECMKRYGYGKLDALWTQEENPSLCYEVYGEIDEDLSAKDIVDYLKEKGLGKEKDCNLVYEGKQCCETGYSCYQADVQQCYKIEKSPWKCSEEDSGYVKKACSNGKLIHKEMSKEECLHELNETVYCEEGKYVNELGCLSCDEGVLINISGGWYCATCPYDYILDTDYKGGKCVKCTWSVTDIGSYATECTWNEKENECTCGKVEEREPNLKDPKVVRSEESILDNPCPENMLYDPYKEICYSCDDDYDYNLTVGLCEKEENGKIVRKDANYSEPIWPVYLYNENTETCYYCDDKAIPNVCNLFKPVSNECVKGEISYYNFILENHVGLLFSFSNDEFEEECTTDTCKLVDPESEEGAEKGYFARKGKVKVFIEYLDSLTNSRKDPEIRYLPKECAVATFMDSVSFCKSCIAVSQEITGGGGAAKATTTLVPVGIASSLSPVFTVLGGFTASDTLSCLNCLDTLGKGADLYPVTDNILICVVNE